MKQLFLLLSILSQFISFNECLVQIELKKSMAKFHHEYLKNLKFVQINSERFLSSFLEEKETPLHKQV